MSLFIPSSGQRVIKASKLGTTSAVTLCEAIEKRALTIESISISVGDNPVEVSLWASYAGVDYFLMNFVPLLANSTTTITDHHVPLAEGWSLKALASVSSIVDIIVVAIQSNPTQGSNL